MEFGTYLTQTCEALGVCKYLRQAVDIEKREKDAVQFWIIPMQREHKEVSEAPEVLNNAVSRS